MVARPLGVTPDDRPGADAEGADAEGADPEAHGPETQDRFKEPLARPSGSFALVIGGCASRALGFTGGRGDDSLARGYPLFKYERL